MTKEEKQLLLKDLCARLPYGFIIHRYSDNRDITFEPNELDEFAHFLEYSEGKEFKPYLRPMSSMTEEEEQYILNTWCEEDYNNGIDTMYDNYMLLSCASDFIDWLKAHHFDYRGLIPMDLALEASKDMYKTE